jgi:hypothetical protein
MKSLLIAAVAATVGAAFVVGSLVFAQDPQPKSVFANWDAVKAAQAKDAESLMRAVELYAPQPVTERIEAYVCPDLSPAQKVSVLNRTKRDLRAAARLAADDPVIVAIDERIESLSDNTE